MIHFSSSVQDSQSTPYEGPFEDDARSDSSAGSEDDGDASISDSSGQISYWVRESAAETLNSDAVLAAEIDQFITSGNWDVSTFRCIFFSIFVNTPSEHPNMLPGCNGGFRCCPCR